jgi:uncharacterized protein involved in exopolysaccharide biosynthesis
MTTPASNHSSDREPGPDEVSLVALATSILRRRRLVAWCGVGLFAMVVAATLTRHRVYTAAASFIPSVTQQGAGLTGLAAQIGLSLPVGEAAQSPEFYASLVGSREVLGSVVGQQFTYQSDTGRVDGALPSILGIEESDSLVRQEAGFRALSDIVSTTVDKRTGVIKVAATTPQPQLSQILVQRILGEVNRFNLERRQLRAEAERLFTERRLNDVRADLRAAEDRLQSFVSSNRDYRNSPVLLFQSQRLERDVQMRQQVYTSLSQAFEQATFEAVRDTPVITIVERPFLPARPDPRGLLRRGVGALLLGLLVGMFLAVTLDKLIEAEVQQPLAFGELARLRGQVRRELARPWQILWPRRNGD